MCVQKTFSFIWNFVSVAVIFTAIVIAVPVHATTVTSANDFVTTLQTSQTANHRLLFTTPSGISEGQTVTISFDTLFGTSSITEDDVDISDDSVQLTTASDCSGSEKASIAIASDIVTITICAGDGGAIVASSQVEIKIGTSATSSGTGSNQITNPSSAGTYFVTIGGTFADFGSIALPIRSSTNVISLTATVQTSGAVAPTPPPPPDPLDHTAPVISNIVVSLVTQNSATISWITDELSSSSILYGLTSGLELPPVSVAESVTVHSLNLIGLSEGNTYSFSVRSTDSSGNNGTSSVSIFTTLDFNPPVISNISATNITKTSAQITWTTNESSSSVVEYGITDQYGSSATMSGYVNNHSVQLSGLTKNVTYYFRVNSVDISTNSSTSSGLSFQTLNVLPQTNISELNIVFGDKTASLSWTNPTNEDFSSIRVLQCSSQYPSGPTDGSCTTILDNSKATSVSRNNLTNGQTYYFGVFAKNLDGQFASGALVLGQPIAPEKQVPIEEPKPLEETPPAEKAPSVGQEESTTTKTSGTSAICGDGFCAESESVFTCAVDCQTKLEESKTGIGSKESFQFSDLMFTIARGALTLPSNNKYVEVLPGTTLSVRMPASSLGTNIERVTLSIGADTYLLRQETISKQVAKSKGLNASLTALSLDTQVLYYVADVLAPSATSLHPVTLFVEYKDGSMKNVSSFLRVVAPGKTYEENDGEETSIPGVKVTLFSVSSGDSVVWDGSPYNQFNPAMGAQDGTFAWYVPNGSYSIRLEKEGYKSFKTDVFTVTNQIANPKILMISLLKKEPEPTNDVVLPSIIPQTAVEQINITIQAIRETAVAKVVQKSLDVVRESPTAQTAAQASLPTLAVTAGASVVVLSVAFDFLPFVQYLFTAPILFFWRKRRKGFGTVYNAISKEPVDLAVVRLFEVKDDLTRGKLVRSRVTDKGGRFYFLVQPGKYLVSVTKAGFLFPSVFLENKKEDVQFLDLYHGEVVDVKEKDAVITPNVPLDPSIKDKYHEPKQIIWRARLRYIQHFIALSGVVASAFFAIIRPNILAVGMVVLQIGIYFIVQRIAKPRKPKSWGIVYDKTTKRPLANVVARIFEPKYNKLLETQVTDSKGRYTFLLGPNEYFAVFEKQGYESAQVKPIDYRNQKESKDFSMDINLHPSSTIQQTTPSTPIENIPIT